MSRIRLFLVSLVAVLAVSAVASASALATPRYVLKTGSLPTAVSGTSGESTLTATMLGVKIEIKCKKDTFSSTLESGGKSGSGSISVKECKLATVVKKCKLTSSEEAAIPTTFNEDQLEEKGGRLIDRFEKVGATNTFATIVIEKVSSETCTIEGSYKVAGSQYCEVDASNSEAETFKEEHELICGPSGSELYIGSLSNPASFTSEAKVKPTGGGEWKISKASCPSKGQPIWKIGGQPLCVGETHSAEGSQTKLKIHDIIEGKNVGLECTDFAFKQKFEGGEPGTAIMTPKEIVNPCEVTEINEAPTTCKVEEVSLSGPAEEWDVTLVEVGGDIWQHIPPEILPLKYKWEAPPSECPEKTESDSELEGNFGPFKPGPENGLSFKGEAVEAES